MNNNDLSNNLTKNPTHHNIIFVELNINQFLHKYLKAPQANLSFYNSVMSTRTKLVSSWASFCKRSSNAVAEKR